MKPLPGQTLNATIGAWNFIAPQAENIIAPALTFIGDQIAKGFNFISSQFSIDYDDVQFFPNKSDTLDENAEYEEVKLLIDQEIEIDLDYDKFTK